MNTISYADFLKVEIRIGTIVEAQEFPEARKAALKLFIDFGPEFGIKQSSSQITQFYSKESLVGKQVLAVVNFPEKQVGPFMSQVLTLGLHDIEGHVVLVSPDFPVPNGEKLL